MRCIKIAVVLTCIRLGRLGCTKNGTAPGARRTGTLSAWRPPWTSSTAERRWWFLRKARQNCVFRIPCLKQKRETRYATANSNIWAIYLIFFTQNTRAHSTIVLCTNNWCSCFETIHGWRACCTSCDQNTELQTNKSKIYYATTTPNYILQSWSCVAHVCAANTRESREFENKNLHQTQVKGKKVVSSHYYSCKYVYIYIYRW